MQRSEARHSLPLHPTNLSRQPAIHSLAPGALDHAVHNELANNLSQIPSPTSRRRKNSAIVVATYNAIKLDDLRRKIDITTHGEPIVGRIVSQENHATNIPEQEKVRESARSKALNAYKMLRERKTRMAFARDYIEDKQAQGLREKLRTLVDTIGFSIARRRGNMSILANDVFIAFPVALPDGSAVFERIHKPQTPEEARTNLQYLYDFGMQNGQTEVPVLNESLTYALVPHHPSQDMYRTRKNITYVTTEQLGKFLTDEGFAQYTSQLIEDTDGRQSLTDVSAGVATRTLHKLGAVTGYQNVANNSNDFAEEIARGGFDEELLDTYFGNLKPRKTFFGRRKIAN